MTILRMILDKVIYLQEYDTIDKNMSNSNAGARKDKNCRNHSFIVNGVLHSEKMEKGQQIDVHIFDVKCCFDEVWPADAINVLYDLGLQNDNLSVLHEETKKAIVTVNSSVGKSEQFEVNDLLCQGSSWGPLKTSATVDLSLIHI